MRTSAAIGESLQPGGGAAAGAIIACVVDETEDATRRTRLASERTFLAWWRTGLTAFAVAIGAGRIVPAVAGGPQIFYTLDGILFAGLGIFIVLYSRVRARELDEAVSRGEFRRLDDRVLGTITGLAAVGGLVLAILIAVGR